MKLVLVCVLALVCPAIAEAQRVRVQVHDVELPLGPAIQTDGCREKIFSRPRCRGLRRPRFSPEAPPPAIEVELVLVGAERRTILRSGPPVEPGHRRTFDLLRTGWVSLERLRSIDVDIRSRDRLVEQLVLTPHDLAHACVRGTVGYELPRGGRATITVACSGASR